MSGDKNAVLRLDASAAIGGGHLSRCVALAEALRTAGWECAFALGEHAGDGRQRLEKAGLSWVDVPADGEPRALAELWRQGVDLLVVDHYQRDYSFEAACRSWARNILVIDDLADRRHDADFLVDTATTRRAEDYKPLVPAACRIMVGPAYALLHDAFRRYSKIARLRQTRSDVRRLLISFGATDPRNLSEVGLRVARQLGLRADIVIGGQAPQRERLQSLVSSSVNDRLHVDVAPEDLAALMAECDVAIGAGGVSALERCCLGLPSVLVAAFPNQHLAVQGLVDIGAAWAAKSADEALAESVAALSADVSARQTMANRAAALVDGLGARRVAAALNPATTANGSTVSLRPVTMADADLLLRWQSHPETRRYAHNPAVPSSQQHLQWMSNKLSDPDCFFSLVLRDGVPVGVIRADDVASEPLHERRSIVSIVVAPHCKAQGIGRAALTALRQILPDVELLAEVHADNAASHRLFRTAGYLWNGRCYASRST